MPSPREVESGRGSRNSCSMADLHLHREQRQFFRHRNPHALIVLSTACVLTPHHLVLRRIIKGTDSDEATAQAASVRRRRLDKFHMLLHFL